MTFLRLESLEKWVIWAKLLPYKNVVTANKYLPCICLHHTLYTLFTFDILYLPHCSHFTSCLVYMGCVTVTAAALCVYGGERAGAGSPDLWPQHCHYNSTNMGIREYYHGVSFPGSGPNTQRLIRYEQQTLGSSPQQFNARVLPTSAFQESLGTRLYSTDNKIHS